MKAPSIIHIKYCLLTVFQKDSSLSPSIPPLPEAWAEEKTILSGYNAPLSHSVPCAYRRYQPRGTTTNNYDHFLLLHLTCHIVTFSYQAVNGGVLG